jgi:hypothetical protein
MEAAHVAAATVHRIYVQTQVRQLQAQMLHQFIAQAGEHAQLAQGLQEAVLRRGPATAIPSRAITGATDAVRRRSIFTSKVGDR